ncbi:MAG: M23 family metallopeptidase [Proteobacteria bacterium]|nr:M23 family metallopeptidase [Pseudomonadota bacterium]
MPYETWQQPDPLVSERGLPMQEGFVQPYSYDNLMRQFNGGKNCHHRGLDIGTVSSVSPTGSVNGGLGTPISAVTRSVVTLIGKTGGNVGEFGRLDTRSGKTVRGGRNYARSMNVPGYGLVYLFSRNYGRWRSGNVIVTKVLDGPLKDYTIRYMHMGAIRPDLKVGSIVEAGEHIAIMGSTAILDSTPHVHIDMENPKGERRDLAPYIGLPDTSLQCGGHHYEDKPPVTPKRSATVTSSKSHDASGTSTMLTPIETESDNGMIMRTLPRTERNKNDDLL